MDYSDVVEVYSAANLQEAHFLKNLLENEGIEARQGDGPTETPSEP
jgi:hypothetical protein